MHRRNASTLATFYPPLPSYEGSEEDRSPPLFVSSGSDNLPSRRSVSTEHLGTCSAHV